MYFRLPSQAFAGQSGRDDTSLLLAGFGRAVAGLASPDPKDPLRGRDPFLGHLDNAVENHLIF